MRTALILSVICNLYSSLLCFAYEGEEIVETVFAKIVDPSNPTLEEWKEIQNFLEFGDRPYLKPIGIPPNKRNGRQLKLVGDNNELPIQQLYVFNTSIEDKDRCIAIFCSWNYPYPGKAELLIKELEKCNYRGHLLVHVGGYPNLKHEGLKLVHIPYSWKLACLHEMRALGYQHILWLDSAVHPLDNLNRVFEHISSRGYLMTYAGFNLSYPYSLSQHLPQAVKSLNIEESELSLIPHCSTQVIGFDTSLPQTNKFLDEWLIETLKVEPCMNWYPEELSFSVTAWRNHLSPTIDFSDLVFVDLHQTFNGTKSLFWDQNRENDPQWKSIILH